MVDSQPPYEHTPPAPAPAPHHHASEPKKRGGRGCLWAVIASLVAMLVGVVLFLPLMLVALAASGDGVGSGLASGNVALIRIDGVIASSADGGVFGSATTSPERILRLLKKADASPRVKVILLRINSPGGVASSGEEIAQAVAKAKKPVVVSIADVGASAAYMIASQSDHIVATPASLVGSIGVILEIPNYEGLYDKLGIRTVTLHEGEFKDIGSPTRPMTASERRFLQKEIKEVYEQFIDIVARGRKMPVSKVRGMATGLFWNGAKAKQMGLVDELGNYDDAVAAAGRIGRITGAPSVVEMERPSFFDALSGSLATGMKAAIAEALAPGRTGPTTR